MAFPRRQDLREQAFLDRAITECLDAGVDVYAVLKPNIGTKKTPIAGAYEVSGDGKRRRISVATRHNNWFPTFIHEFNHFRQHEEGTRWFTDRRIDRMWYTFDDWLARRVESTPGRVEECCREIQLCELDCERRTLRTIRDEGFSINPAAYAQSANSYIWSYEACRIFRRWNGPGHMSPARNRILISKCPTELMHPKQIHRPPPDYLAAYAQQCIERV